MELCPALARVPRQRLDAITRCGRFRSWGDYSVLFRCRSPSSRPIATGGPPRWDAWGATTASAGRRPSGNLLFGRQHHGIAPGAHLAKRGGWIARQQPWRRSQGIARRPKSTAPAAAARGSAALPATVPTAARQHGGRRNAQSALRRRDAGMTIEGMRAKALECTSLYFPDLRWSQPEFQDALAAFFHYILTGAWPPSDHVFK
jgi:hypothetical protein